MITLVSSNSSYVCVRTFVLINLVLNLFQGFTWSRLEGIEVPYCSCISIKGYYISTYNMESIQYIYMYIYILYRLMTCVFKKGFTMFVYYKQQTGTCTGSIKATSVFSMYTF
jgi:hypothetical protein